MISKHYNHLECPICGTNEFTGVETEDMHVFYFCDNDDCEGHTFTEDEERKAKKEYNNNKSPK